MTTQLRAVRVDWMDSRQGNGTWKFVSEFDKPTLLIQSFGVLIEDVADYVRVAGHFGEEDDGDHQVSGVMTIPRRAIVGIVDLREDIGA